MNYAIKTLLNQSVLIRDAIEEKQDKYLTAEMELACEDEFWKNDIENLNKQLLDLINAIEVLEKINHKQ